MANLPRETLSFDDFLKAIYPPPEEGDDLYTFYQQWGYEQYLIRTQKYDIEQLRIIHSNDYNMMLLASIADTPQELSEWAKNNNCPLVEAQGDWTGFVWRKVVKGLVGIALWECDNGDIFCVFPNLNTSFLCKPYVGPVDTERVKLLTDTYQSEEQVIELSMERINQT